MEPNTLRRVLRSNGFAVGAERKDGSWTAKRQFAILSQGRTLDVRLDVRLDEKTEKFEAQIVATEDGKESKGQWGELANVGETILTFAARAMKM